MRVGKKPNIKDQVRIAWNTVFEAEAGYRNGEIAVVLADATRELSIDMRTEFMHIETRCIEKYVRDVANRIEPSPLSAYGCGDRLSTAERVRATRLRKSPDQRFIRSFQKDNSGRENLSYLRQDRRETLKPTTFAHIYHQGRVRDLRGLRNKIRKTWNQFKRKIID